MASITERLSRSSYRLSETSDTNIQSRSDTLTDSEPRPLVQFKALFEEIIFSGSEQSEFIFVPENHAEIIKTCFNPKLPGVIGFYTREQDTIVIKWTDETGLAIVKLSLDRLGHLSLGLLKNQHLPERIDNKYVVHEVDDNWQYEEHPKVVGRWMDTIFNMLKIGRTTYADIWGGDYKARIKNLPSQETPQPVKARRLLSLVNNPGDREIGQS